MSQSHYNNTQYTRTDIENKREVTAFCAKCGEDTPHEEITNPHSGERELNCKYCTEMGVL